MLAAGSFMHFVLAFVLLFIAGRGDRPGQHEHLDHGRGHRHLRAGQHDRRQLRQVRSRLARQQGGLRAGDKIIALGGSRCTPGTQLGKAIRAPAGGHAGHGDRGSAAARS